MVKGMGTHVFPIGGLNVRLGISLQAGTIPTGPVPMDGIDIWEPLRVGEPSPRAEVVIFLYV